MTIKSDNQSSLIELDFTKPNIPQGMAPIVLLFDKSLYRLTSWQELVKIFCYLAYKTAGGEEFFSAHVNRFFYFTNGVISLSDSIGAKRKIVFCDYPKSYDSDIKFSQDCYIRIHWLDSNDIVFVLQYVIQNLNLNGVKIYLGEQANSKILTDELLKDLNGNRKRNRYIDKKAKYFIARINNEVLLPQEKFYKRIGREFDRKVLIGDISISDDEEKYLHAYMTVQLSRLNRDGKISDYYPQVFAYGLVRFAMKYYSQKTFWPYFKEEYGFDIKLNMQSELHDCFRAIMVKYSKVYDDNIVMKIDNISMHCFVTDRCANQLFGYLFDFWRLDLNRDINNIYGVVGKEYFDLLLAEIEANNEIGVADVMKHTSMALKLQKQSCRLRLRRILELMDDCFWNGSEIPQTGNRINELLRKWMRLPNGKFQKEQKIAIANHSGGRGETLLSSPVLCAKFQAGSFYLRLPREILKDYSVGQEDPRWKIKIGENSFSVPATPCEGKIGFYTEECELPIPSDLLFQQIKISLDYINKVYTIKEDCYRFFNAKGVRLDYKNNLPCGLLVLYAATDMIPQKLYGEEIVPEPYGGMFVATYQAEEGDIILFSDKKAVQVGQQIREGLIGTHLRNVVADVDGTEFNIFATLPKLLFRAKREQLAGAALFVEYDSRQNKTLRVKDNYCEFKFDDMLEDVYGYLIDLKDYLKADGFYRIRLSLPASSATYSYQFAFLKDLKFEFIGKPYFFVDAGKLEFPDSAEIETNSEWEISDDKKTLPFVFDTESCDCSKYVQNRDICLSYQLSNCKLSLKFRIPSFYWKYKKDSKWRTKPPAPLSIRKIPNTLYVCGPFDFKSSKISIEHKSKTFFDETEITAQKVGGEDFFAFNFSELKSFLDHSVVKRTVDIMLDGEKKPLLDIMCRSHVSSASIAPDYESGKLIGRFGIIGDSEYCAKIECDGALIGQDIAVLDGTFELETNALGGNYLITLYEIFEDDSGFDAELVELGKYSLKLSDITKLHDRSIEIVSIQDREKKFVPLNLSQKHVIGNLQYLGRYKDVRDFEVNGLWSIDFCDEAEMGKCFFYKGTLAMGDKELQQICNVMVIFPDRLDLTKCLILREAGKEFIEPLYDYKTHAMIATDSGMNKLQKKERIRTLEDDRYDVSVSIGEKVIIARKRKNIEIKTPMPIKNTIFVKRNDVNNNSTRIEQLGLSVRAYQCLKRAHIDTIDDITDKTETQLLKVRHLGLKCVNEIKLILAKYHKSLREE